MAAYLSGYSVGPDALDKFYLVLRTAMLANGWTLHDTILDSVNSRQQVFRSTPIDVTANNCCYLWISISSTTFVWLTYVDWDPVTHTGTKPGGNATTSTVGSTTFPYWVRVNEWAVAVCLVRGLSFTHAKGYAGFVRRAVAPTKRGLTCTVGAHAGGVTTVNVASDMTGKLRVGQRVVIYNHGNNSASANFGRAELLTIKSLTSGTITFMTALGGGYDAGAVIGWNPYPSWVMSQAINQNDELASGYSSMTHAGGNSGSTGQTMSVSSQVLTNTETSLDPSEFSREFQGGLVSITSNQTGFTGFHGYPYHWEVAASAGMAKEETISDGTYSYIVLSAGTSFVTLLGPT